MFSKKYKDEPAGDQPPDSRAPSARDVDTGWMVEGEKDGTPSDDDGRSSPPRGVFSELGTMEVEQLSWNERGTISGNDDDAWAVDSSDDEEEGVDATAAAEEGIFDNNDGGIFDQPPPPPSITSNTNTMEVFPFGSRNKYAHRQVHAMNQEIEDLSDGQVGNDDSLCCRRASIAATVIQRIQHDRRNRRFCLGCILSIAFVGIISTVFLTVMKAEGWSSSETTVSSDDANNQGLAHVYTESIGEEEQPSKPHQQQQAGATFYAPSSSSAGTNKDDAAAFAAVSSTMDVASDYGYPYVQHTSSTGWVTWPPSAEDENSYLSFDDTDGINNLEECAAKCQEVEAPTGVWSVKYQACWCSFIDVSLLCREPCVEDEYIDFSTVPIDGFDHCEKSVCDREWYHSSEYCGAKYDKSTCDAKIGAFAESSSANREPSSSNSIHGYPYVQETSSVGWVTWPPEAEDNDSYLSFDSTDGVSNLEDCAAKCQGEEAPTGAWSVKNQECWCTFIDVSLLCREPCVEDEYVNFGNVPIDSFDQCEKSVCDQEWYHSSDYCEGKYDKDTCDAKIEALAASSSLSSAAAEKIESNEPKPNKSYTELKYKADAMTTVKKWSPDATNGGMVHFSVEQGDNERVSYVRFELPDFTEDDDVVVVRATLNLYLVAHNAGLDTDNFEVSVDALPHAGRWKDGMVTWNDLSIHDRGSFFVDSFKVEDFTAIATHIQRVDVTSAIDPAKERRITFKLYTDAESGRLDFAGEHLNGGENVPELVIVTQTNSAEG